MSVRHEGPLNPPTSPSRPLDPRVGEHITAIATDHQSTVGSRWLVVYCFERAGADPARAARRLSEEAGALRVDPVTSNMFRVSFESRNVERIVTVAIEEGGEMMASWAGKRD